ncbi:SEL1-like repeat protein [Methylohalomonas lacus]|uniref:SEL1-like repeat protein n=1 Tax=Methylohalomonas lacus TaxID=398773 RepID=UPI0038990EEC
MWLLAYAYQFGRWGFPQNDTVAIHWYEQLAAQWKREAERGESEAQSTLKVLREFARVSGKGT